MSKRWTPTRPSAKSGGAPAPGQVRFRARRVFHGRGFPYLFPPGKSVPDTSVLQRASLRTGERSAVEEFSPGRVRERIRVLAFPLHRDGIVGEPPPVCGLFLPA